MMAYPAGFGSSRGYRTAKENLKVGCANLPTGQAAAQFVTLTVHPLSVNNRCRR